MNAPLGPIKGLSDPGSCSRPDAGVSAVERDALASDDEQEHRPRLLGGCSLSTISAHTGARPTDAVTFRGPTAAASDVGGAHRDPSKSLPEITLSSTVFSLASSRSTPVMFPIAVVGEFCGRRLL
jgi:hypothetical protein